MTAPPTGLRHPGDYYADALHRDAHELTLVR